MKSFNFLLAMQPCVVSKEVTEITLKLSNKDLSLHEENTFLGIFTQKTMIFCYLILFLLIKTQ